MTEVEITTLCTVTIKLKTNTSEGVKGDLYSPFGKWIWLNPTPHFLLPLSKHSMSWSNGCYEEDTSQNNVWNYINHTSISKPFNLYLIEDLKPLVTFASIKV